MKYELFLKFYLIVRAIQVLYLFQYNFEDDAASLIQLIRV